MYLHAYREILITAIFGGHISGKRSQNGKINPVFLDGMLQSSPKGDNPASGKNGIITGHPSNGIDTNICKSISNTDSKGDLSMASNESVNGNSQQELRQENLKVTTNGDVCVGDIVIENGVKNQGFDSAEDSGMYSVIKALKNSETDTSDYEIHKLSETDNEKDNRVTGEEVIVGNVTVVNHTENTVVNISDQISNNQADWPEIDDLILSDVDHNQNKKESSAVEKSKDLASTSEIKGENHVYIIPNKSDDGFLSHAEGSSSSVEQVKNEKNSPINTNSKHPEEMESEEVTQHSEQKVHKSILIHTCSADENDQEHKKPNGTVSEHKSVKFTKDTVDNEEKPKKYKKEKIFISNIYRGRITNNAAVAKTNPMFLDDDGFERSLTDDEKAARYSFRKIRTPEGQFADQLNIPAYMQEYVLGTGQMTPTNMSLKTTKTKMDSEIENLGEVPAGYDKLIRRTVAKERRNKVVRLTLAIFAFLVVVAAVVLIVVFLGKPKS